MISKILNLNSNDIYNMWETRLRQVLETNGMNTATNSELVDKMFDCARKYLIA